jgi:hypothetical protein
MNLPVCKHCGRTEEYHYADNKGCAGRQVTSFEVKGDRRPVAEQISNAEKRMFNACKRLKRLGVDYEITRIET